MGSAKNRIFFHSGPTVISLAGETGFADISAPSFVNWIISVYMICTKKASLGSRKIDIFLTDIYFRIFRRVLSAKNFAKGEKPAIDYGLSVSRLGGNVQAKDMKKMGSDVRSRLLSYLDVRSVYELANTDEMSEELQARLRNGKRILDTLKQYKYSPRTKEEMIGMYDFLKEAKE